MTRAERREANKQAHAIRRQLTDADFRAARAAGESAAWRDIWDVYAAIPVADVLAEMATRAAKLEAPAPAPVKPRRKAPAHVLEASEAYRLARYTWEAQLEEACRGGMGKGPRCKCSDDCGDWNEDECRFRREHPAPVYREFLQDHYAGMRAAADQGAA